MDVGGQIHTPIPKPVPSSSLGGCCWLEGLGGWEPAALLCADPYTPAIQQGPGGCACRLPSASCSESRDLQPTSKLLLCVWHEEPERFSCRGHSKRRKACCQHLRSECGKGGFCLGMKQQSEGGWTLPVAGDCFRPHPLCSRSPDWLFPTSPVDPQISKCFRALQKGHQDMVICSFLTCRSLGSCRKPSHCTGGLGLVGDAGKGTYFGCGTY